ncbi:MAG: ribosome biogenesis factor YjgA [Mariprofundaceae bacterium]
MHEPFEEPLDPLDPLCDDDRVIRPNKSQLKRDAKSLLILGKKLVDLDMAKLQRLEMPDELRESLYEGKSIHQNGARKRHFKFVGKLLREMDTELLEKTINELEFGAAKANAAFHKMEHWRNRLLDVEDSEAFTLFMSDYPNSDASRIRQLIRNAQKELLQNKPGKSSRALFQQLREDMQKKPTA